MDEEKKTVTLYRIEDSWRVENKFTIQALEAVEKPNTYTVLAHQGYNWTRRVLKADIGREYFLSAEDALRAYIAAKRGLVASCNQTAHNAASRAEVAEAMLAELLAPDESNG